MLMVGMVQWWYGAGLQWWVRRLALGMLRTADFFSIGLLARTLFQPFRQIDAGGVQGALPVQLRAWFDRTFSRLFGAMLRSLVIIVGLVALLLRAVMSLMGMIVWLVLPLTPVIGVVLWQMGVAV
ncbi:MAG: hypothetical protein Q4A37_00590 [Candidatus Saccharibacteria bacterium]|nr:hypothetical protein [Candidatus Saccharibacteria bacterium]